MREKEAKKERSRAKRRQGGPEKETAFRNLTIGVPSTHIAGRMGAHPRR